MSQTDRIVAFLNAHNVAGGLRTVVSSSQQRIKVRSLVSGPDGQTEVVEEIIPANMLEARNWLGY